MSDSAIHDAERDEWRSAVRDMTEVQRVQACGHEAGHVRGICPDCGHDEPLLDINEPKEN